MMTLIKDNQSCFLFFVFSLVVGIYGLGEYFARKNATKRMQRLRMKRIPEIFTLGGKMFQQTSIPNKIMILERYETLMSTLR